MHSSPQRKKSKTNSLATLKSSLIGFKSACNGFPVTEQMSRHGREERREGWGEDRYGNPPSDLREDERRRGECSTNFSEGGFEVHPLDFQIPRMSLALEKEQRGESPA